MSQSPIIGPLIVMPQKVVSHHYGLTCHLVLCDILHHACRRAILAGHLKPDEAFHLQRLARRRDSGTVRTYVERVMQLNERGERP